MKRIAILFIIASITGLIIVAAAQELTKDEQAVIVEADQISRDVADLLGAKITRDVKKGFKSKDELVGVLETMFAKEYPPEKAGKDEKFLKFLGLIPKDMNLLNTMKALLLEQIGGFYDPETKELYLIRAGQIPMLDNQMVRKTIMAHELCHSIQDMYLDLNMMMNEEKIKNDDLVSAFQSFIEGQATVVMMQYLFKLTPDKLPDLGAMRGFMAESGDIMGTSFKEFKNASMYLKEKIALFPYVDGAVFYRNLLLKYPDKKPVEFFSMIPKSTEQVLHFEKYVSNDQPSTAKLESPDGILGSDWNLLSGEILGELEWRIMLSENGQKEDFKKTAEGWDGTTVYLYENGKDKNLSMILISTWDTQKDADEVLKAFRLILNRKYPMAKQITGEFDYGINDKGFISCIVAKGTDIMIYERIPEPFFSKVIKASINIQHIN